jgi:hypothetical protein
MFTCDITTLPLNCTAKNIGLICENNIIYTTPNNTKQYLFNVNNVKSFCFEQNNINYRFYFNIDDGLNFKNQILMVESESASLIDLMVKNIPNINLTNPTMPYWSIFTVKYSTYYNSKLYNLAIFSVALINVILLIYNLIYPYISTIHVVKFLEQYNVIKYFDALSNLYIYILITKFTDLFRKIGSLFPKGVSNGDSKIFKKMFDFGKFLWSFLTSDYYRMQYKKRYLSVALFAMLSAYILYINI